MNDDQIETLLRKAPGFAPPPGLQARLRADITLSRPAGAVESRSNATPWFRRWLPALGFAGCLLVCAVVFAVQTGTLSQLRQENEALQVANQKLDPLRVENAGNQRLAADNQELQRLQKDNQELQQLRGEVARLRSQVGEIARLRTENQQLQAGAAGGAPKSDPDFFNRVPDARSKSERIQCVNNLKQIGLAGRIWASDHGDVFPSDFQTMINELGTPKILHCPGDGARPEAASWAEFSAANNSYEMLSPGVADSDPQAVYVRCPIHNNVALGDGSVQQLGPNLSVVPRDGKYYISNSGPAVDETLRQRYGRPAANSPAAGEAPATNSADEILRQRYGLPKSPNQ